MSGFSIRLAHEEDAEAMSRVEDDAGTLFGEGEAYRDLVIGKARTPAKFRSILRKRRSLVAEADGEVIGLAAALPFGKELHLEELSVARRWQGRGVGGVLLRALCIDAANSGYRAVTLETFCEVPWNRPFYERNGFAAISDLAAHPRLKEPLDAKIASGMPAHLRCAMIRFLD